MSHIGIGIGLGLGSRTRSTWWTAPSATLKLLFLPTSIQSTAGVVTGWTDLSGNGYHATATGSPVLETSDFVPGVLFDGVDDRLDGSIVMPDQPCTIFLIKKQITNPVGTRAIVFEMSDAGYNRSTTMLHLFGSAAARQCQKDNGNASYVFGSSAVVLHRCEYDVNGRAIHENGRSKGSEVNVSTPIRTAAVYRFGQWLSAQGGPWNGVIYAVAIYAGTMSLSDKERIQRQLLSLAGIAQPFSWPITAATDVASDPRFILPATIPAIVGRPLEIWKDSVHYRDGADASQVATGDLLFDSAPSDRWAVTPPAAGSYALTIAESGFSASTTIQAVEMLAPGAPLRRILWVGDSNTARAGSGWIELIGNELGASRAEMVGTRGPNTAYTYKHCGVDSSTWVQWGTSATLAGGVANPMFNGGVLDIVHFLTLLANPPDVIMWTLGQNDAYSAAEGAALETAIDNAFAAAEILIAAFAAELPAVKHALAMNFPLAMDPAAGWGTAAARLPYRRKVHRWAERVLESFGDREDENIFVVPTFFQVDPIRGYTPDTIHPNSIPGHQQIAAAFLAWLVAHWT